MKNILKKLCTILLCIFGIYLILCGITTITSSIVSGITFIISGIACTPLYNLAINKFVAEEKRTKFIKIIKPIIIIVFLLIAVIALPEEYEYSSDSSTTITEDTSDSEEEKPTNEIIIENGEVKDYRKDKEKPADITCNDKNKNTLIKAKDVFKIFCKEYNYEEIFRNAEDYVGKNIKFKGHVEQVDDGYLRIAVTEDEYGYWDDVIFVTYPEDKKELDPDAENRLLEDDIVTVYGTLNGTETYESIFGENVTIPSVEASYIELNK